MKTALTRLFTLSSVLLLVGSGCAQTTTPQPFPAPAHSETTSTAAEAKPYRPEDQTMAASGKVFIEREHFSGMNHCADVIHVFRGQGELFRASLTECQPEKSPTDPTGHTMVYRYVFEVPGTNVATSTVSLLSKTDPTFTLLDSQNELHPNQIWVDVNGKTVIYDEGTRTVNLKQTVQD